MSHLSTVKTKLHKKQPLIDALLQLNYRVDLNQYIENPIGHTHEEVLCDIIIGDDIGFKWNCNMGTYELVTDLQTWKHPVPPERLLSKITQQYAIEILTATAKLEGFQIEDKKTNSRQEVELILNKWSK